MLKSRTTWPPGGWMFREPKTGWKPPAGYTFGQTVEAIISHRRNNPRFKLSTDQKTVENELDEYTCARLRQDPNYCLPKALASFPRPLPGNRPPGEARGGVAGVTKFLQNAKAGIKTWLEWYGDGRPASKEQAEARAAVCVVCPQNEPGNMRAKFTEAAANEILGIFAALHDLNLHTSQDDKLYVCKACDCPMKAKCWTPLPILLKHMTPESFSALDPKCWIRAERASLAS